MAQFGIPYMGSKSSIAKKICAIFPKADNFYDLFGGGFSITHCMLKYRKDDYKNFHFNEIRPGICQLIQDAIEGKYSYANFKPKFVERDEFLKSTDPYIKLVWSFGNNYKGYMFNKEVTEYKRSMHNAVVFNEFDQLAQNVLGFKYFSKDTSIKQRKIYLGSKIESFRVNGIPKFLHKFLSVKQLQHLGRLEQLDQLKLLYQSQQLERIQQLQQLEQLKQLKQLPINFTSLDYRDVKINPNAVIYCDIPYGNTSKYSHEFNYNAFYDWADKQQNPVFVSEYNVSDKRFKLVFKTAKRPLFAKQKDKVNLAQLEKVYVNKSGYKLMLLQRRKSA